MKDSKETKELTTPTKRTWTSPKLLRFGHVSDITQQVVKFASTLEDNDPLNLRELVS